MQDTNVMGVKFGLYSTVPTPNPLHTIIIGFFAKHYLLLLGSIILFRAPIKPLLCISEPTFYFGNSLILQFKC